MTGGTAFRFNEEGFFVGSELREGVVLYPRNYGFRRRVRAKTAGPFRCLRGRGKGVNFGCFLVSMGHALDFGVGTRSTMKRLATIFFVCGGALASTSLLASCSKAPEAGQDDKGSGDEASDADPDADASSSTGAKDSPSSGMGKGAESTGMTSKDGMPSKGAGNGTASTQPGASSESDASSSTSSADTGSSSGEGDQKVSHSLAFEQDPKSWKIRIEKRSVAGKTQFVFVDALGREVQFRGFNTSGSVKLVETGYKPFKTLGDAKLSFSRLRGQLGSNLVRFTVAWEGIHPEPGVIDTNYLDMIALQMRAAIEQGLYVIIDYHSDLYSRYTFRKDSKNTGNGAPAWIVKNGNHGTDDCGLPCEVTWGAHKLSDNAVRSAMRAFWTNAKLENLGGDYRVQDSFLWQLKQTARHIRKRLTRDEMHFVLGIEPLNEPFDGGLSKMGVKDYKAFDNDILWPFYQRVRKAMDEAGWKDKWVFAEPMVFWSSEVGALAPATGGHHLDKPPGEGFVFSPHFYDQGRQGVKNLKQVRNGAYFPNIDKIRDEADFLQLPVLVTEFGTWIEGKGRTDTMRTVNAVYQALESSDIGHKKKDRFVDYYSPMVGAAQWHWDIYFDRHHEYQNGNPDKLLTKDDAWNRERYSVINDFGKRYNVDAKLIERAYPRRVQGKLLHFAYQSLVKDQAAKPLHWHALRLDLGEGEKSYFGQKNFAFLAWTGKNSDKPSEIYLPRHFDPNQLTVISDKRVYLAGSLPSLQKPNQSAHEAVFRSEGPEKGHRLWVWDDSKPSEPSPHFVLVLHDVKLDMAKASAIQKAISQRLLAKKSPVFLTGAMTHSGYPVDPS